MKRSLSLILLALVFAMVASGFYVWIESKGAPADEISAKYLQAADRFVEIDGARVRVRIEGSEDAPVILLVHGFTHSLETWDVWADELSGDYRVIRYDLLGHGLTGPDPKDRYAPTERATFMGDLLNALGVEKAVIAGNSLGGLAAWRFASQSPESVEALILISPGAFSLNGVTDKPAEIPAAMRAYLLTAPEAGVRASAALIYGDDTKITDARVEVMRDMLRREGNGAAMIRSLEKFTLPDPTATLAGIETPTLVLWGTEDIIIPPAQGEQLARLMPNARLITYQGVGHAAQEEAPAQTLRDARAFLEELKADDAQ